MIKESEYCSKIIESELNKPIVMATKDHDDFENYTKCWISKKENEEGEVKVQVHDHIDGKYWESSHQDCNLNLSLSQKMPVVFHNLQNYDSYLIFQ